MTFLFDVALKAAVVLGIAFLVALALRQSSASIRYALWTCALAAVLILPLASWVAPGWNIDRGVANVAQEAQPGVSVVVHGTRPRSSPSWPSAISIWIAGAGAMLLRIAAGHWRLRSMFGAAEEIRDQQWLALAGEVSANIGFQRAVILKRSTATDVPLSYGLFRATVLLPGESDHWTEERRRVVLSHEMIHARRLDSLWGLIGQLAVAVHWFNPLAWLAAAQLKREQERSCDDAVISAGIASTVYAAHLVDLARSISIPEPALGMAERFDLEGRVHALLDAGRARKAASRKLCAAMFSVALVLIVPLAAVRAQPASPAKAQEAALPGQPQASKDNAVPNREVAINKPVRRPPVHATAADAEEPQAKPVASLAGSVYDPSGGIVPGASISLKSTSGSEEEFARVNSGGQYKLQGVPAGEYLIKVTAPGFAAYQKTISLDAGTQAAMNVNLAIGEMREAVEIVSKRQQPAAPSSTAPQRIRVGGNVQPCNLIAKVNPAYPADAKAEGVEGTVLLRAVVSKDGSLLSIKSISTGVDQRLVEAAVAAVTLWRYQPALLNNMPVEVITTIDVTFRLD
jgi:TonB family protein